MNLITKQKIFSQLVARLIQKIYELNYECTLGEVWRPSEISAKNKELGIGIKNSNHCIRLAIDINLFSKDGKFLRLSSDHKEIGEWWESQSTPQYTCCWGGRFGDGNHYSLEHNGIK